MKHTEIALRRPVTTVVVFVALGFIGLLASRLLPLEQFPDIEFPGIFIQIPYEGSTPEEIERLITRPVEEALATLSGVERMFSRSNEEQAEIFLQFDWDQNMGAKGIEARAKIDAIRNDLPPDIRRFLIFTGSLGDQPVLQLRVSSERDLGGSYDLLDRLVKRRIERIEGVSRVEIQGVEKQEMRVLMDLERIAAHNVDINALRELLMRSNFAVSAGRITDGNQRFSIRPQGEFRSVEQIRNFVIDDTNLRLKDVADVELVTPPRFYGRHLDREYAVGIVVSKTTGANLVEVTDRVLEEVEEIGKLPQMQGISMISLDNQGDSVRDSLRALLSAGLWGALLALIVLYLFLRQATTTLIVVTTVPFSLMITLGALYFAGLSLNILTMMGLMLAVGMLVDNAVVITESIFRHRYKNPDEPYKATLAGVKDVGLAVITGTMTTIIVFVPIMFGTKTDITVFMTHVSVTIIVALLASLLIAQTLVPMLAARIKPPPEPKSSALMGRLTRGYGRSLGWILRHPVWASVGVVATLAIGIAPMALELVKFDMFPEEPTRRLFLPYNIEGQHSVARVEAAVDRVENYLYENQEELNIRSVYSYFDTGRAESTLLLTDEDDATRSSADIMNEIEENIPEIVIGDPSFESNHQGGGGGDDSGFSIQISGDSTSVLNDLAYDVVMLLESVDGLDDVYDDGELGEREVRVRIDRVRAANVGLSSEVVGQAIAIAMRGENLREFRTGTGEVEVRMAFRPDDRQTIDQLADLPLQTPDGTRINLGSVADFEIGYAPDTIRRTDRQTALIVSAKLEDDVSLDDVKPDVEALLNEFDLPPGYSWKFGRGFERSDETQQMMLTNILLGIACIFLVMAALFESLLFPFAIILGSIAFSILGVFLFFAATGTTFSFMAMIGIMILIGVVVNNGIVLVDHINNLRQSGVPRNDAIIQGGVDRLRPILMTVATTIVGLTPLAMSTTTVGGDGPAYFPMARAIIGGLAFSTIVSLLLVPALYAAFDTMARWGRNVMRSARGGMSVTPGA